MRSKSSIQGNHSKSLFSTFSSNCIPFPANLLCRKSHKLKSIASPVQCCLVSIHITCQEDLALPHKNIPVQKNDDHLIHIGMQLSLNIHKKIRRVIPQWCNSNLSLLPLFHPGLWDVHYPFETGHRFMKKSVGYYF